MTSFGEPLTEKCTCVPLSWIESGPSVREVFAGVGINDFTSPLAAADVDDSDEEEEDELDELLLDAALVADELAETVCVTVAVV
jgi:hypothetical protein